MGSSRSVALLFSACALAPLSVGAATLGGIIEDASGALIEGAQVSILQVEQNQRQSVFTDAEGRYQFLYLTPGKYQVSAEHVRFAKSTLTLTVSAGQTLYTPIRLGIAGQNTSVTVLDSTTALETVKTQVSDFVKTNEIDNLPLNGRNYLDLALLVPGDSRTNTGAPQQFAETSAVPGTGISFASQRNLNNSFMLDGLSINDDAAGLAGTFFSQEVIREFQVVSAGGTAELGRASSGFIAITTKSGTNNFHGRGYGFLRNQRFDARNALATRKDPLTQSQYGASLGGPLRKDRTFFYTNFEQTRRNAAGFITIAPANVSAINNGLDAFGYGGPRMVTGEYPTGYDISNFFARADHQLNASHQLMGRYSVYDLSSENARSVGALNDVSRGTSLRTRDHVLAGSSVASFSPTLLNEARIQFTLSRLAAPGNDQTGPAVNISGIANFGASTTSPVGRDTDSYEFTDDISLVSGNHTLRAGADVLWNRLNIFFPGSQLAGVYSFSSLANFQAGRYSTFQQAFGEPYQFQSNPNFGVFLQDAWKVRPQLTLQLGIRYDIQKLPSPIQTDFNNVAPRFGIAWSPDNSRTVVRANYGLFYDRIPLRATSNALQRDGSKYRAAVLQFGQPAAPVFPAQLAEFPSGTLISISTIDPNIQNSYTHQASFQIEREIGSWLTVSAGYQWLRGLHLILSRNINVGRPNPNFGNISRYEGSGDSYFNGLLTSFRVRVSRGVDVRVSYTLSKAIDDVGNFFFSSPQNNFNLRDDRGLSDNDQRHRLTATAVCDLPYGIQFSPLFLYTSALPFNVLLGFDRNGDTNLNDRPMGIGRNTGRGFNFMSVDSRLSRTFKFHEHANLQVLAEGFNLLNRTNRSLPNAVVTLPTFGRATAVNDSRQLQFGLRITF